MFIDPGNFFIMRETESHYIDHKIDGDLRWLSNRYEKNDVVAVLLLTTLFGTYPTLSVEVNITRCAVLMFLRAGPIRSLDFDTMLRNSSSS